MLQSINLPLNAEPWPGGIAALRRDLAALGLDGVEGIWDGVTDAPDFPPDLLTGYHLTFYPDWLDFYRCDFDALRDKFGSLETAFRFYGGALGHATLLELYRKDLQRALRLGAKYVVFHVSDVSIEEGYSYRWLHRDWDVIEAAVEILNELLADVEPTFDLLLENQWWPGFTFTAPHRTAMMLEAVDYPRTGLLLDTGHLMNCDTSIRTQADGLRFIHRMLDEHGDLCRRIRGVHLHQSRSGAYVRRYAKHMLPELPEDYAERFAVSYAHIQRIDCHLPWTDPGVAELVARIDPAYLTHELAAAGPKAKLAATRRQLTALGYPHG